MRVAAFRQQIALWLRSGRIAVPLLVLPDAPPPEIGRCVSCGLEIPPASWRCDPCLHAVEEALR
jgi:hypothetical protein